MALQMLTAVVVLSVCGLRLIESAPRWTSTPYDNKKVYQVINQAYTFVWRYDGNGTELDMAQWYRTKMNSDNPPKKIQETIGLLSRGTLTPAPAFQSRVTFTSGASQAGFQIRQLTSADNGRYICQLLHDFYVLSDSAELVVVVPPVITNKLTAPQTIDEGQTFNIPCAATGNPKPKIRWLRNGIEVQHLLDHSGYNITDAGKKDKGLYRCEAIVTGGNIVRATHYEVTITVRYRPVVMHPNDHPKNSTLNAGQTVTFTCKATGNPPTICYVWRFKGAIIPGQHSATFSKQNIDKDDEGRYSCSGVNSRGEGPQAYAYLFIKNASTTTLTTAATTSATTSLREPTVLKVVRGIIGGGVALIIVVAVVLHVI